MAEGWRRQTIGEIVRIASGQVDPRDDLVGRKLSVGPDCLRNGGGIEKYKLQTANNLRQISGKYAFDKEAILYAKIRPNLNKVGLPDFDGICSADVYPMWIRNADASDRTFVYFLLTSDRFVADASSRSFRTGLPKINRPDLEGIIVALPPLPEQRKIAKILRTWEEAIEKLDALIDKMKRQHLALAYSLIFGRRRLLRFKKSDDFKAHHWFAMPKEWDCQPIGKLAIEVSERNGNRGAFEVLLCSKYEGFIRSLEYFKKQVFSSDLTGYKKIWRGDFGFPSNHVEEGSIGLQDLVDVGIVSPIYTVFRFMPEKMDRAFAFRALKTSLYRHIFAVSTSASVDRRGSLRWKEFAKIPFPVPPRSEQEAISEVLAVHSRKLTALQEQRDMYARQKRGLMQKLLTGEWRVKVEGDDG